MAFQPENACRRVILGLNHSVTVSPSFQLPTNIAAQLAHRFFPFFDFLASGTHGASPRDARTKRSIS
ncbi:MAG: hypothetical protein ABSA52_25330, partial [Candidatus Binatia bacterium]